MSEERPETAAPGITSALRDLCETLAEAAAACDLAAIVAGIDRGPADAAEAYRACLAGVRAILARCGPI